MSDMPSEFTKFSSDELIQFQKENFAESKELRHEMCALLDSRSPPVNHRTFHIVVRPFEKRFRVELSRWRRTLGRETNTNV
jgi:hypothetical protein